MKKTQKILSLFLSLVMLLSCITALPVMADDEAGQASKFVAGSETPYGTLPSEVSDGTIFLSTADGSTWNEHTSWADVKNDNGSVIPSLHNDLYDGVENVYYVMIDDFISTLYNASSNFACQMDATNVVIDLGGHTLTFESVYLINHNVKNGHSKVTSLTFKNGTIVSNTDLFSFAYTKSKTITKLGTNYVFEDIAFVANGSFDWYYTNSSIDEIITYANASSVTHTVNFTFKNCNMSDGSIAPEMVNLNVPYSVDETQSFILNMICEHYGYDDDGYCDFCDWAYVCSHCDANADGRCDTCEEEYLSLVGHSVTLGSTLGINFYAAIPDGAVNSVAITVGEKTKTVTDIAACYSTADQLYKFSSDVSSVDVREDITIVFLNEEGKAVRFMTASKSLDSYTTTTLDYAQKLIASTGQGITPAHKNAAEALLNYAAYAELYFGKVDSLSDAYSASSLAKVTDESIEITGGIISAENDTDGILGKIDLVLDNTTKIRIHVNTDTIEVTNDEEGCVTVGTRCVEIRDVKAHELSREYSFTINGVSVKLNAIGVADYIAFTDTSDNQHAANLMKALYLYSYAADHVNDVVDHYLNNTLINDYVIVYEADSFYAECAAKILCSMIEQSYGVTLTYQADTAEESTYEILLGDTTRISDSADDASSLGDMEYIIQTVGTKILLVADGYMIGGATGGFIDLCADAVEDGALGLTVTEDCSVQTYEYKKATSALLYIGDGMGENHIDWLTSSGTYFYAEDMEYQGWATTHSANSSITDSAAGGTALATGYKTKNNVVGLLSDKTTFVQNIRELAYAYGANTAVLTTDSITGATPATFTAHTSDRDNTDDIAEQQALLVANGEIAFLQGLLGNSLFSASQEALLSISANGSSFFMMLEEGKIDTYSHSNSDSSMLSALNRFNQTIAYAMQFALIRGDVLLVVTADHETGGVTLTDDGYVFTSTNHTDANVKVFAMGDGAALFDSTIVDNVMIPQKIAEIFGASTFGSGSLYDGFVFEEFSSSTHGNGYAIVEYTGTATDVIIPNSYNGQAIVCVYGGAFESNTSIESVTIVDGIKTLTYSGAFKGCTSLTSVTIPTSVTDINWNTFNGCTSLTNIYYRGTCEEWKAISKGENWDKSTGDYTVYCTDGEISKV